jgi:hypothetical protein
MPKKKRELEDTDKIRKHAGALKSSFKEIDSLPLSKKEKGAVHSMAKVRFVNNAKRKNKKKYESPMGRFHTKRSK